MPPPAGTSAPGLRRYVIDHPLVAHKLSWLRDVGTPSPLFRLLCDELVTLLAYEATRDVRVETCTVRTPLTTATGFRLAAPPPIVVPILRAGLGMLDGMMRLLPTAEVGFLGLAQVEDVLGSDTASVTVFVAGLDDGLNELGYIVPGLGDAGDRLFGLAE